MDSWQKSSGARYTLLLLLRPASKRSDRPPPLFLPNQNIGSQMRGSDTGRRNIEYNPSTVLPQKPYNSFSRHREEAIICHLPPTPTDQTLKISSSGCVWSQLGPSEKVPQPLSNVRGMFTETKEPGKITLQEEETQCWDLFMFFFEQVSPKDGSLSICSYYKCLKSVPGR